MIACHPYLWQLVRVLLENIDRLVNHGGHL